MILQSGDYIIVRHSYWSMKKAGMITIVSVDANGGPFGDVEEVNYFYTNVDENGKLRKRTLFEFSEIELIPSSSLLEQLV